VSVPAIRLGTRGSRLALVQAEWVKARLSELYPTQPVEIRTYSTHGDRVLDAPLAQIGGKGVFTREIDEALLRGEVDLAVHSLKDLPTLLPAGIALAAVPEREDPRDVAVIRGAASLEALPVGARVATSSLRRRAQLLSRFGGRLSVVEVRGNVDTRLRFLDDGRFDAVVLARAGLRRLGLEARATQVLPPEVMLPAPGQGALGITARNGEVGRVWGLTHLPSYRAALAERAVLRSLGANCQVPLGAYAEDLGGSVRLRAVVCGVEGSPRIEAEATATPEEAGATVSKALFAQGAAALLRAASLLEAAGETPDVHA